jgi:hypothetical protein
MNVAVVEFNYYHDEILPTIVHALNALGIDPDVYVPARAARKDAFALTSGLRYRVRLVDGRSRLRDMVRRIRGTPARHRRYDLLVMNSIEPDDVLQAASRIDLPTLAVVHNADRLVDDGPYAAYFADRRHRPIYLGRHVARPQVGAGDHRWLAPVFLGDVPPGAVREDARTILCVQGNVEYTRRDYGALVEAVIPLAAERSDFVIRVVGRSDTADGRDLRARVEERGVADRFTFSRGVISHRRYLTDIGTSDFIMPLLDGRQPAHAPYLESKITSSISMSVGLRVIPIAEAQLASLYGVESVAVTYEHGGLPAAIRTALDLPAAVRSERIARLESLRSTALTASVANIAAAIDDLGVAR